MTIAAAEEVYQVLVQGQIEGQICENVLYFRTHLGDSNVETHLLKAIFDCFLNNLVPVMPKTYRFNGVFAMRVTPDVGPIIEHVPVAGDVVAGLETRQALPSYCSTLISIHSERAGRSGKGRMFLAGVPEEATEGSFLNTDHAFWLAVVAYVACVTAAFIHTGDFPVANQWEIGVLSRKFGGLKPPFLSVGFSPALRLVPKINLATTRSRKVGRGA